MPWRAWLPFVTVVGDCALSLADQPSTRECQSFLRCRFSVHQTLSHSAARASASGVRATLGRRVFLEVCAGRRRTQEKRTAVLPHIADRSERLKIGSESWNPVINERTPMSFWHFLFGITGTDDTLPSLPDLGINPANGLPMIEGTSMDVEGNLYSTDSSHDIPSCGDEIFDSW